MGERDPSWAGVTFDLPGTLHGELYPSCIPPKGRRGETRRDSNCALPSPATRGRAFKKMSKGRESLILAASRGTCWGPDWKAS